MTIAMPSPEEEITRLMQYAMRLEQTNERLAAQLVNNADRLEGSKRELMAQAWQEGHASGTSRAMRHMSDEPGLSLKVVNPYRQPLGFLGVVE